MLYLVGLGLGDPSDITVKGLEIVKKCSFVYLESYTSMMPGCDAQEMARYFGKEIITADRDMVEQKADEFLLKAKCEDVAFLVIGDPFGATTHTDLVLRAKQQSVPVQIIHNASIMNAIGACGLQLYSFGETVSIPFWTETWQPDSFLNKILQNKERGLHTLCLLDIKVKEPNLELMVKGKLQYDPPRFMTVNQAVDQIIQALENKEHPCGLDSNDVCIGVARVGSPSQIIFPASLLKLKDLDFGPPLHSLVICGNMHPLENEFIEGLVSSESELINKKNNT